MASSHCQSLACDCPVLRPSPRRVHACPQTAAKELRCRLPSFFESPFCAAACPLASPTHHSEHRYHCVCTDAPLHDEVHGQLGALNDRQGYVQVPADGFVVIPVCRQGVCMHGCMGSPGALMASQADGAACDSRALHVELRRSQHRACTGATLGGAGGIDWALLHSRRPMERAAGHARQPLPPRLQLGR